MLFFQLCCKRLCCFVALGNFESRDLETPILLPPFFAWIKIGGFACIQKFNFSFDQVAQCFVKFFLWNLLVCSWPPKFCPSLPSAESLWELLCKIRPSGFMWKSSFLSCTVICQMPQTAYKQEHKCQRLLCGFLLFLLFCSWYSEVYCYW